MEYFMKLWNEFVGLDQKEKAQGDWNSNWNSNRRTGTWADWFSLERVSCRRVRFPAHS